MLGLYRGAAQRKQVLPTYAEPSSAGFTYAQFPTNRGDLGAGVKDYAFVYPFSLPALFYCGKGVPNQMQLQICQGNPAYWQLSVPTRPAQGPGNIAGTLYSQALLANFYNPGENTAYF
jgi:hypothetical protein